MSDVFANPEHVGFWEAARRAPAGEKVDWEEFLAGSKVLARCGIHYPEAGVYVARRHSYPPRLGSGYRGATISGRGAPYTCLQG
jgi:hypothetical protein